MNPLLLILLGWLMLGLETGLKDTLAVRWGAVTAAPSFVIPLAAFVALSAPPVPALWTCIALGIFLDLTAPQPTTTGALTVIGPHALGLMLAGQFVLLIRAVVLRRHALTLAVMAILGACVMHIVVTAIFTARQFMGDPVVFAPTDELVGGLFSAVLTGALALLLSVILLPLAPLMGMPAIHTRFGRR